MKTKKFVLLLCASVSSIFAATASVVTESRRIGSFQEIRVELGIDVYFTQENSKTIEIEADEEVIKKIITRVEDQTLIISREMDRNIIHIVKKNKAIKVYVSSSVLNAITLSDGADFYADNLNCKSSFQASASGGCDIRIDQLIVSGNTTISTVGASDCKIEYLQGRNCFLSGIGASEMKIDMNLSGNLFITASEGSTFRLSGSANHVSATASANSEIDVQNMNLRNISVNTSGNSNVVQ